MMLVLALPLLATMKRAEKQSSGGSGEPPMQVPALHVWPVMHGSVKQVAPLLAGEGWQASTPSLQTPVLHVLLSEEQSRAMPAPQVPPPQSSPTVQKRPSSQGTVLLVKTQPVVALHESSVQRLASLHTSAVPLVQFAFWQTSTPLQMSLSPRACRRATARSDSR
jgi:hypothetical protein